ncbi:winged helix-turn-helix transcriptional regulator [Sandaracinobacter sp.]|uniref:winged helix-turn-helix transcriptional regulator n=1 Tax=Sandaracinobacter sp. TaxID=2487581 RepID=UPI0035B35C86
MKAKSFAGMRCSIAGAMELIGDRWAVLLIRDLTFGLSRYDDLRTSIGIPAATLSARLKQLVDVGIVERVRYQDNPPRDEYHLTAKGRDLWKVLLALREWGDRWDASGFGAPSVETFDADTGRPLRLGLIDPETRRAVPAGRARLRPGPAADAGTRRLLNLQKGSSDDATG